MPFTKPTAEPGLQPRMALTPPGDRQQGLAADELCLDRLPYHLQQASACPTQTPLIALGRCSRVHESKWVIVQCGGWHRRSTASICLLAACILCLSLRGIPLPALVLLDRCAFRAFEVARASAPLA